MERRDGWIFWYDVSRVDAEAARDLAQGEPEDLVQSDGAWGWLRAPAQPPGWWVPTSRFLES